MNCSHTEDSLFLGELIAEQDMAIITEKSDFFIDIFEMSIDIL